MSGEKENLISELMELFADPHVDRLTHRAAAEIARLEEALFLARQELERKDEALASLFANVPGNVALLSNGEVVEVLPDGSYKPAGWSESWLINVCTHMMGVVLRVRESLDESRARSQGGGGA